MREVIGRALREESPREALDLWVADFDDLRADIEEYTDREDFVICAVRWHGRAKDSGPIGPYLSRLGICVVKMWLRGTPWACRAWRTARSVVALGVMMK